MRFLSDMFDVYLGVALMTGLGYAVFSAYKYNVFLGAAITLVLVFVAIVLGTHKGRDEY